LIVLRNGYTDVPHGKIAAVVTYLEMTEAPPRRAEPAGHGFTVERVRRPSLDWYRDLYRRIGEHWLWFSRLRMADDKLAAILGDPRVEIYALRAGDQDEGLLELHFSATECNLAFFGVAPALVGSGAGRVLMNKAVSEAWSQPIRRFTVNTCTLDHPNALAFYIRSGFRPYRRKVELADDPRLDGTLPRDAAPQVPILE